MISFNNYLYVYELFLIFILLFFISKNLYVKYFSLFFITVLILFYRSYTIQYNSPNFFLSPSQSKIIDIKKKNNYTIIYTYLSPFNLHYMISPTNSIITNIQRNPTKKQSDNLTITFKTNIDGISYYYELQQIVNKIGNWGYLPSIIYKNRCITWKKINDELKQGEPYGLIRFGSMMKYIIPNEMIKKNFIKKNKKMEMGEEMFSI